MITDDTGRYAGIQSFQALMLPNGRVLVKSVPLGLQLTMLPHEASTLGNLLLAVSSWSAADPVTARQAAAALAPGLHAAPGTGPLPQSPVMPGPDLTSPAPGGMPTVDSEMWHCRGCGGDFIGGKPAIPGETLCLECRSRREWTGSYPPPVPERAHVPPAAAVAAVRGGRPEDTGRLAPPPADGADEGGRA